VSHPILLYDGVCGLCNRVVQFILKRDVSAVFRFASLQSSFASSILERHGKNALALDAVYLAVESDSEPETLLAGADAAIFVLRELSGVWGWLGAGLRLLPRSVRDGGYRLVARNRYKVFGRYDSCPAPSQAARGRFLDQ